MVDLIINLISETHYLYERRKYTFIILQEYIIIFREGKGIPTFLGRSNNDKLNSLMNFNDINLNFTLLELLLVQFFYILIFIFRL